MLVTNSKRKGFGYSEPNFPLFTQFELGEAINNLACAKLLEKQRVNAFSQSEIEHFEYGDDDLIISDAPSNENIISLTKEKNNLINDSSDMEESLDMKYEGDTSSDPSIFVNILQNFFATETVDTNIMYSLLIIDKKIIRCV
ncbi:hypothetical protein AVEN_72833-1 [Araneus ventricosus]|uniref:Uncharacterized protein n=1 Tax=Araneus ventricosus TaxID=182803 RepID=A0A4Y2FBW7_ARAVE|nr:hypothetical protein AVEN_72833-1 [Araneus ventricosus]